MATMVERYRAWGTRHPWQQVAATFVVLVILAVLVPPRDNLVVAAVKVAAILGLILAMNLALYGAILPSWGRIRRENDRYERMDRAIREGRTDAARLEATLGRSDPPLP